jgi:hypothetical protein
VGVGIVWGAGFLDWLGGVSLSSASEDGGLRMWFVPFGLIGVAAVVLLLLGPRLSPRRRMQALAGFVVVDLIAYTILAIAAVFPAPGQASTWSTQQATSSTAASESHQGAGTATAASSGASTPLPPTLYPASDYTQGGRFAIYDPDLIDANGLNVLEAPDLNVVGSVPSIQGYSSLVDGFYANATGTHVATGLGQNTLSPQALENGTLNQLDMTALFAPRGYFLVPTTGQVQGVASAGDRTLQPRSTSMWYLGENLLVKSFTVPDTAVGGDLHSGIRFSLLTAQGRHIPVRATDGGGKLKVVLDRPTAAVALIAQAGKVTTNLGFPTITSADGTTYTADGELEGAVTAPGWIFDTMDGPFGVYENANATPPLTLRSLSNEPGSLKGASVRAESGPSVSPTKAYVSSPQGAEVVRDVTATAGWHATWQPSHGRRIPLNVSRTGLVQSVTVPAGTGVVTWTYDPPGWNSGWIVTVLSSAAFCALVLCALIIRRRARGLRGRTE